MQLSRKDIHNYQYRMIEFIKNKQKVGLFMDMGLGKTVTTLTAILDLLNSFEIERVLVVAPLRVANSSWPDELAQWEHLDGHIDMQIVTGTEARRKRALATPADVYVTNRENVVWLMEQGYEFDMLVIDESPSFKSAKSKRFKALRKLKTEYTILLTGTPAPQSLMDLWSQIFFLDGGERLGRTIGAYRNRFFRQGGYGGYTWSLAPGAEAAIYDRIVDLTVSLLAKDYLELPEKINVTVPVILDGEVRKLYKKLKTDLSVMINDEQEVTALSAAGLANKLLQLGNGFLYTEEHEGLWVHNAKIDALKEIVENYPCENILVFYNFNEDLVALQKAFPNAVQAGVDGTEINQWNDNCIEMLLAQPASASEGLNLQAGGAIIVWYGLSWNLYHYLQGNARLHRQGQLRPVTIIHLVVQDGIDELVVKALEAKAQTQEELMKFLRYKKTKW